MTVIETDITKVCKNSSKNFADYMRECLYSADGFYNKSDETYQSAGRRGSFITSPEVGPLFGLVLANKIDYIWHLLERPSELKIYDIGSNSGALIKSLQLSNVAASEVWDIYGVDYQNADYTPEQFADLNLKNSIVIANELIDNLPFRIFDKNNNQINELCVLTDQDDYQFASHQLSEGEYQSLPVEIKKTIENLNSSNWQIPVFEDANLWVKNVLDRDPISLLAFDYGCETTEELTKRDYWLRTYQHHILGTNPLIYPKELDITSDIALDQLPSCTTSHLQSDFLKTWGIDDLVDQGKSHWYEKASAPDLTAMQMRSRVREAEALLDEKGLGSWLVAEWRNY